VSRQRATLDGGLPPELRTNRSGHTYQTPRPEAVRPPEHDRAIDIGGTLAGMLRLTRRAVFAMLWLLAALAGLSLVYAFDTPPVARVWVTIAAMVVVLASFRRVVQTAWAWRYVMTRPWEFYGGGTYVTESTARVRLLGDHRGGIHGEGMYFDATATKEQREQLRTPMFAHIWFAGDADHAGRGLIVPAGGGPLIAVRRLAVLTSPAAKGHLKFVRFRTSPARMRRLRKRYDRLMRRQQASSRRQAECAAQRRSRTAAKPRKSSMQSTSKARTKVGPVPVRTPPPPTRSLPSQLIRRRQNMSNFLPMSGPDSK